MQVWNYNLGHSSLYGHYGFERELESYIDALRGKAKPAATFADVAGTMKLYETLVKNCIQVDFPGGGN